jgi:hypothetical protein
MTDPLISIEIPTDPAESHMFTSRGTPALAVVRVWEVATGHVNVDGLNRAQRLIAGSGMLVPQSTMDEIATRWVAARNLDPPDGIMLMIDEHASRIFTPAELQHILDAAMGCAAANRSYWSCDEEAALTEIDQLLSEMDPRLADAIEARATDLNKDEEESPDDQPADQD